MKGHHIDRSNGALFLANHQNQSAAVSMRKYQQLSLALLSIISLIAFLFYKHAYDRLHFTFEYLETFGTVEENNVNFCGTKAYRKLYTTPAYWQMLTPHFAVYSTFWDIQSFTLFALVLYKGSPKINVAITDESNSIESPIKCIITPKLLYINNVQNIRLITCPSNLKIDKPFLAKFKIDTDVATHSIYIQKIENWRDNVVNASCMCVFPSSDFISTNKLVEFLSYHNSIGVEKFVFYGHLLTPTVRKLLDMNGDEMGIVYEEKQFSVPSEINLTLSSYRKIIEIDCVHRHKNFYENVIILNPSEYIIIKGKPTLTALLSSMPFSKAKMSSFIYKYSLMTQDVCYKDSDFNKIFVSIDLKVFGSWKDDQVSIIRPHLMFDGYFNQSLINEQHIPTTSLEIYNFISCSSLNLRNNDSLTMNNAYAHLIEGSLLYKKWKIYN